MSVSRAQDSERLVEAARRRGVQIPVPIAAAIIVEVLDALNELHAREAVHGGLGNAHIVVGDDGHARLLERGAAAGGYAAPELAAEGPTPQSDLYAVGACFWLLFAGSAYREADGEGEGQAAFALQLRKCGREDASAMLGTWLWKMLYPKPSARPQSADKASALLRLATEIATPEQVAAFVSPLLIIDAAAPAQKEPEPLAPPPQVAAPKEAAATRAPPQGGATSERGARWRMPAIALFALLLLGGALFIVLRPREEAGAAALKPPVVTAPAAVAPAVAPPAPVEEEKAEAAPRVEPAAEVAKPSAPAAKLAAARAAPHLSNAEAERRLKEAEREADLGHNNSAEKLYGQLLDEPRVRARALLGLARIANTHGNFSGAIRWATEAAQAGAGTGAWMLRGVAHLRTGSPAKAEADFDRVLAKEPNNRDAQEAKQAAQQQLAKRTAP